jgi:hypothetical protein
VFFEQGLKLFVPIADFVGIKMIAQNPSVYACFCEIFDFFLRVTSFVYNLILTANALK